MKTATAILISLSALALPGGAVASYTVPPGNSAATQYTEAFPTGGGNAALGRHRPHKPKQVLGRTKLHHLDAQGPAGEAVAALTASTAPQVVSAGGVSGGRGSGKTAGSGPLSQQRLKPVELPSALGEVSGQATGLFAGASGALVPLALLAAALWAVAYVWRSRRLT